MNWEMLVWIFVLFIISLLGDWARLATCYRAPGAFEGPQWHFQSGHLGLTRYKGILTFGADREGLYLAISPCFASATRRSGSPGARSR